MNRNNSSIFKNAIALLSIVSISIPTATSQIKYTSVDEKKDAGMGLNVWLFLHLYTNQRSQKVIMRSGGYRLILRNQKIDGIKPFPGKPWGPCFIHWLSCKV